MDGETALPFSGVGFFVLYCLFRVGLEYKRSNINNHVNETRGIMLISFEMIANCGGK